MFISCNKSVCYFIFMCMCFFVVPCWRRHTDNDNGDKRKSKLKKQLFTWSELYIFLNAWINLKTTINQHIGVLSISNGCCKYIFSDNELYCIREREGSLEPDTCPSRFMSIGYMMRILIKYYWPYFDIKVNVIKSSLNLLIY